MDFRFRFFLLIIILCGFIQVNAQTVGVYASTFFSGWYFPGFYQDYKFGKSAGMFANGFLKGKFNPGVDVQYSELRKELNDYKIYSYDFPFYENSDSVYNTDVKTYKSITAIRLDLEFTSPQVDTFVICFGLQPGIAFLQDRFTFSDAALKEVYFTGWVPSLGGSGTLRRNHILGSPLQLFFSASAQGYLLKSPGKKMNTPFYGSRPLIVGFTKIGLAYKFN